MATHQGDAGPSLENPYSITSLIGSFENLHATPWLEGYLCIGVLDCNAHKLASFSRDAFLDMEFLMFEQNALRVHYATTFAEIFTKPLSDLMRKSRDDTALKAAVCCLEKFNDGDHLSCLQKLTRSNLDKMSEADIQTVLACHLFSPLLADGEVFVDQVCYNSDIAKCCFCGVKVSLCNTNFGCRELWHGRADIVIMNKKAKKIVQVSKSREEKLSDDDDNDHDDDDDYEDLPPLKKPKLENSGEDLFKIWNTFIEVKKSVNKLEILKQNQGEKKVTCMKKTVLKPNKAFIQAICQTIVNAFLVSKENKNLENHFIPSFLVTAEHIYINLYNVGQDVLLAQSKPFQLLNEQTEVVPHTVFAVWLALNFEKCPGDCSYLVETYYKSLLAKSGLKDFLVNSGVLEMYQNNVEFGFTSATRLESVELLQPNTWNFPQRLSTILKILQTKTKGKSE